MCLSMSDLPIWPEAACGVLPLAVPLFFLCVLVEKKTLLCGIRHEGQPSLLCYTSFLHTVIIVCK